VVMAEDSLHKDRGFELDLMETKLARILKKWIRITKKYDKYLKFATKVDGQFQSKNVNDINAGKKIEYQKDAQSWSLV
jgi:uncharacterized protein YdbL (DUF1318 family)